MQAAGRESDQKIAFNNRVRLGNVLSFHRADGESRQIIFAVREIARMFSGLAADQHAARLPATLSDAADYRLSDLDIEFAAYKVIQEEQRLGALRQNIVHAHRDKIDSDRIMNPGGKSDFELRADAVGRGHQDRLTVAATLQIEERAKAADA